MVRSTVLVVLAVVVLASTSFAESEHPSKGHAPQEVNLDYGKMNYGFHADLNFGEVTFADLPARDNLTPTERYMLAGCKDSAYGYPLDSWYTTVWGHVSRYWEVTHQLPDRLTPEAMQVAYGDDVLTRAPQWLEEIKSPITGEYPRVTAAEFSPGDVFVHLLTPAEINFYTANVPVYKERWSDRIAENMDGEEIEVELQSPIMFIRVYGENSVIENQIIYSYSEVVE